MIAEKCIFVLLQRSVFLYYFSEVYFCIIVLLQRSVFCDCREVYFCIIAEKCISSRSRMMRREKKKKQEFCQSRFYKDWNPDIMADYNRWQKRLFRKSRFQIRIKICVHLKTDFNLIEFVESLL